MWDLPPPPSCLHFTHSSKLPQGLDEWGHGRTSLSFQHKRALTLRHCWSEAPGPPGLHQGAQELFLPQLSSLRWAGGGASSSLRRHAGPRDPPGLLAAARHPHMSTTQSGEFVRMASEIILAPDWPMRFPCRLGVKGRGAQAWARGRAGSLLGI